MNGSNRIKPVAFVVAMALALAACGPLADASPTEEPASQYPLYSGNGESLPEAGAAATSWGNPGSRLDNQGAIAVEVTPQNFDQVDASIDFQVSLNTHSVDLSMDLADLATLTTDTGLTVLGASWDGAVGGHHVTGTLSFPASINGHLLRDGANEFVLVIRDLDAAERSFSWSK